MNSLVKCCCQDREDGHQLTVGPVSQQHCILKDATELPQILTRQDEKSRLQDLVKAFTRRVVRGVRCRLVEQHTGTLLPASYRLDRMLHQFILKVEGEREVGFELVSIKDVLTAEECTRAAGTEVLLKLAEDVRDSAVAILLDDRPMQLCILDPPGPDKDAFITCMRILRLYAKQAP